LFPGTGIRYAWILVPDSRILHDDQDFSAYFRFESVKFGIFTEIWLLLLAILFTFNDLF